MLINTGIDIIEISRIKSSIKNPKFLSRVFSPQELKFFVQKSFSPSTSAANFSGKEAFSKSLGTGFRGISLNEISILRDSLGQPYLSLSGKAKEIQLREKLKFSISLSHSKDYATAIVVGYRM